jgi:hypothetical protein
MDCPVRALLSLNLYRLLPLYIQGLSRSLQLIRITSALTSHKINLINFLLIVSTAALNYIICSMLQRN